MPIINGVVYKEGEGTSRFTWLCRKTNKVHQNVFMKKVRMAKDNEPNTGFKLGRLNNHI